MKNCLIENQTIKSKRFEHYFKNKKWTIIILFFSSFLNIFAQTQYSNITLRVNKSGNIKILGNEFPSMPDIIYINGISQNGTVNTSYKLNETENYITLIWNTNLKTTFNMFEGCSDIIEINLSNFNSSQVTDMSSMFKGCTSLVSLDFTGYNTEHVTNMESMFRDCSSLVYLNLSNFITSSVNNMRQMFRSCSKLRTLDLSNIDTSKVTHMGGMFEMCSSLDSIDLSSFNTSNVQRIDYFFSICSSLKSLDLSNFDTSSIDNMEHMFEECKSLSIINLSNFDTRKVGTMHSMFKECLSLTYLNLSSFVTTKVTRLDYMFYKCESLISLELTNFITNEVYSMDFIFEKCSSLTSLDLSKFVTSKVIEMGAMFSGCSKLVSLNLSNFNTSITSRMDSIFKGCLLLKYLDISNFDTKRVSTMREMFYHCSSLISLDLSHFETSNVKEMDHMFDSCSSLISIDLSYFNVTFVTSMSHMFYNCSKLVSLNLHNFNTKDNINIYSIFDYCSSLNYLDISGFDIPQTSSNTPLFNGVPKNITICFKNNKWKEILERYSLPIINCYNTETSIVLQTESELEIDIGKDNIITQYNINKLLKQFDKFYIENGNDIEMYFGETRYSISSFENQKRNKNKNITSINFVNCEHYLKTKYVIPENNSLYIIMIEIKELGMYIPKIEYGIYYQLYNNETLFQLDLDVCKNDTIDISIPISINDTIEKHNKSSNYYIDMCSRATTSSGTDITLDDRKNEFIDYNMTLCEEDCILIDYNYTTKKAECSCLVKIKIPLNVEIKFDKKQLFKSFTDINYFSNIYLIKCYKDAITIEIFKKNYGFFIFIIISLLFFVTLILFYTKYFSLFINFIYSLEKAKTFLFKMKKNKTTNITINNKGRMINDKKKSNKKLKMTHEQELKKNNDMMFPPIKKRRKKNYNIFQNHLNLINNNKNISLRNKKRAYKLDNTDFQRIIKNGNSNETIDDNIKKYVEILKHNDNEINSLKYKRAIIYDKRTYLEYYISLLRANHFLIFSFYCNKNDYNIQIIKIFLFFFFIGVDLTINALFFTDDTIHKIYVDKGNFNFIYQIPKIIYSSLISSFIATLIKYLSLSENVITKIKQRKKSIRKLNKKIEKIIIFIKIKFILFFIISFCFIIIFSFYIICFCGIYINTQVHLIKDTLISLGVSLIYPFGIYLIPGLLRIPALNAKMKNRKCLYKLSQFIQTL